MSGIMLETMVQEGPFTLQLLAEPLEDYRMAVLSRHVSRIIRREVMSGRAKFGVSGDGKELAQIAMSKVFQRGDFRSGYYRDQTLMLALDMISPDQIFAQLYAHTDIHDEPSSGGRSMVGHFGTRLLDERGQWLSQVEHYNSTADISPTAGQMPRLVGLAYASRFYREIGGLDPHKKFSCSGNEVAFGTIGNASCAEGLFWESLNEIGMLQVPAIISIWDDDYGISVPNEIQFAKGNVGPLLEGFRRQPHYSPSDTNQGFDIYQVRGWDYPTLLDVYRQAAENARKDHIPAIIHVVEMTQPLGHTTSGSHERYKSPKRLAWEEAHDPLRKMYEWLLREGIATTSQLDQIQSEAAQVAEAACNSAWDATVSPLRSEADALMALLRPATQTSQHAIKVQAMYEKLSETQKPLRKEIMQASHQALHLLHGENHTSAPELAKWRRHQRAHYQTIYSSYQHSESEDSPLLIPANPPIYDEPLQKLPGFEILRRNFDALLAADPRISIFGEDVGKLGDVNQGVAELQQKYGAEHIADTGIREAAIIGRAIGMAQRGLRPIAEIQYIDYILYALTTLSDDLACLHWRTKGGQKAPVIVRTRGHRLEGIWHSGSPMGALLNLLRGMHILVPRNMTQAAGFYNTLLQGDDPALVVERLNAYRLHEALPTNLGTFTVPLGKPEILQEGSDITVVTYGATCQIAQDAAHLLEDLDISAEVIDVQSLLPFDIDHTIVESLKKTSRVLFLDEDMPGGASAYMMQQVLEVQNGYQWLDAVPLTMTAQPHRPAYGSDGDYFSKPNVEDVTEALYAIMQESDPSRYPPIW